MSGAPGQARDDLGYEHVIVPGTGPWTLLLLHAIGFTYVGLTSYWHDRRERLQGT